MTCAGENTELHNKWSYLEDDNSAKSQRKLEI